MPRILTFDIETDSTEANVLTCLVARDLSTGEELVNPPVLTLSNADILIGHNVLEFDLPALHKLTGWRPGPDQRVIDTLILSRLQHPEWQAQGSSHRPHSLDSWGNRLGFSKGQFTQVQHNRQALIDYCRRDVELTERVYKYLRDKRECPDDCITRELEFSRLCFEMGLEGFRFDRNAAQSLYGALESEYAALEAELQDDLLKIETDGRLFATPVALNIGSRQQVVERLKGMGWKPEVFLDDEKTKPALDEDILSTIDLPAAAKLSRLYTLRKRMGQIQDGNNGWLKLVTDAGRIHHTVNTLGTITGRCSHKRPNLGQVPNTDAIYGPECRSLFIADEGCVLVGSDLAGVEGRCLAHYLNFWDGGKFSDELLNGDIHSKNQEAAGLPSRSLAKRFFYLSLYGGGAPALAAACKMSISDAKDAQKRLFAGIDGYNKLRKAVEIKHKNGTLKSLAGMRLKPKSPHKALNYLLQSLGAVIAKEWALEAHRRLLGTSYRMVAHVHDEIQSNAAPDEAQHVADTLEAAAVTAGEALGLSIRIDAESKIGLNWSEVH